MTTSRRFRGATGIAVRRHVFRCPDLGRAFPSVRRPAVWLALALLAAAIACAAVLPLRAFGGARAGTGTVFAHLSWGAGDGEVGLIEVSEGLTRGPEALAIAPDGRVAVLDSVNHRLVLLDTSGLPLCAIALDLALPRFLAADDQILYVLDSDIDETLATYSWSGDLLAKTSSPATDDLVTGLFATSEGPCIELAHDRSLLMAGAEHRMLPGRPLGREADVVASASYKPSDGVRLHTRSLSGGGAGAGNSAGVELSPDLAWGSPIEHLLSLDGDGSGGLFVGARLLRPQTKDGVTSCLALTRLPSSSPDSARQDPASIRGSGSTLLLDESDFAYLGPPYTVAPDGRIFQPVADESGYSILVHSFEEVKP